MERLETGYVPGDFLRVVRERLAQRRMDSVENHDSLLREGEPSEE